MPSSLRSLLFAPGNRADLIAKLPRSGADAIAVDLEDAVPANAKVEAREITRSSMSALLESKPTYQIFIRTHPVSTLEFSDDIKSLIEKIDGIVIPKIETPRDLQSAAGKLEQHHLAYLSIIAGFETARGIEDVSSILREAPEQLKAVYFGAEDFITDMGGERTRENLEVLYARSKVVLAAKARGLLALDQVVTTFKDDERFMADAKGAKQLGYTGKLCIHPSQVALAHKVFTPSEAEVERAQQLLERYHEAAKTGQGVIEFEGQMVDEPVLVKARAILAVAGISSKIN
ncbi:MAG: HpcH/HpaI aldolase/citrate lyase family protein [Trueperaceae bacterium]